MSLILWYRYQNKHLCMAFPQALTQYSRFWKRLHVPWSFSGEFLFPWKLLMVLLRAFRYCWASSLPGGLGWFLGLWECLQEDAAVPDVHLGESLENHAPSLQTHGFSVGLSLSWWCWMARCSFTTYFVIKMEYLRLLHEIQEIQGGGKCSASVRKGLGSLLLEPN